MAGAVTSADWLGPPPPALPAETEQTASLYRRVLVVYLLAVFYAGMSGLLYRVGIIPLYTQALLAMLALPLVLSTYGMQMLRSSTLLLWVVGYLMLSGAWFLMSSQPPAATAAFKNRILAMVYFGSVMLVFADWRVHRLARKLILFAVLLQITLLLAELVTSVRFGSAAERGTGLYENPNAAGAALLTGWIVTAGLLDERRRHWLAIAVGVGTFLTFSRGAIIMWLAITAVMLWQGKLRMSTIMSSGFKLGFIVAVLVTLSGKWTAVTDSVMASLGQSDAISRLTLLREWDVATNPGTSDRVQMINRAWGMFAERPLLGHGLGSTFWSDLPSTHNTMLRHMADHGVFGLLIYPLFIVAVVWRAHPALRQVTWPIVVFLIIRSMVSHQALDDYPPLACVALVAAMVAESRPLARMGWRYALPGEYHPPDESEVAEDSTEQEPQA